MTTIDHEWVSLGRPDVSLIKIDVEGSELDVLAGASECMKVCRPYILVEWTELNLRSYNRDPIDILRFCQEVGYQLYSLPAIILVTDAQKSAPPYETHVRLHARPSVGGAAVTNSS